MKNTYSLTEARKEFSRIVKDVQYRGDSYIISRHGEEAAAVVPIEVYKEWKRQRDELFQMIRDIQGEADLDPQQAEKLAAEAVAFGRSQPE